MNNHFQARKLDDVIEFNPKLTIKKGELARKISMSQIVPFSKRVYDFDYEVYKGGSKFQNKDTIMARITPCLENGKISYVDILEDDEIAFGSTEFLVLRAREGISDPEFVYYFASSPQVRDKAIHLMTGTSGRQRVQLDAFKNEIFFFPDLETQRKIAQRLSKIDELILVLTTQNQNLEELIDLAYRQLLTDLKNNYSLIELGKVCNCLLGGTPSRKKDEYWNGNIPWINSGEINKFRITKPTEYITESGLKNSSTKLLPRRTTVIAITGATLGQVSLLEIDACANQSVIGILENETMPSEFIYPFMKSEIKELMRNQTGGAQQHINNNNVKNLLIPQLDETTLENYKSQVKPFFGLITKNLLKISNLEKIRDLLLPRLITGELDLSEFETDLGPKE